MATGSVVATLRALRNLWSYSLVLRLCPCPPPQGHLCSPSARLSRPGTVSNFAGRYSVFWSNRRSRRPDRAEKSSIPSDDGTSRNNVAQVSTPRLCETPWKARRSGRTSYAAGVPRLERQTATDVAFAPPNAIRIVSIRVERGVSSAVVGVLITQSPLFGGAEGTCG
jgi:hypothetical protein